MNWVIKALVKKLLSSFPEREKLDYLFQTRVTKTLPHSDEQFNNTVAIANGNFNTFIECGSCRDVSSAIFYEFGCGWDLTGPLAYYAFGIEHQTLIDIRPNLHFELIENSIERFARYRSELERLLGRQLRPISPLRLKTRRELQDKLGITYIAPLDAADTKIASESFDFISSTSTLEHIPEVDVGKILVECRRLLKPDGVMCCRIDLRDHFCDFDSKIGPYNFLKFPAGLWACFNSSLHFLNRLRYPDYIRLAKMSGLAIAAQKTNSPSVAELDVLRSMRFAAPFRMGYSVEELGAKGLYLLLRKGDRPPRLSSRPLKDHRQLCRN
jgi:SAM-dependent methyltransferase